MCSIIYNLRKGRGGYEEEEGEMSEKHGQSWHGGGIEGELTRALFVRVGRGKEGQ
jgi:hypothetical protein